jgi:hypothetical protein
MVMKNRRTTHLATRQKTQIQPGTSPPRNAAMSSASKMSAAPLPTARAPPSSVSHMVSDVTHLLSTKMSARTQRIQTTDTLLMFVTKQLN